MPTWSVGHTYHKLRHFLVRANWSVDAVNQLCLQVMWECRQTKPSGLFALIIDDSGHRKSAPPAPRFPRRKDGARSGNLTAGVG
ncbi:MAG: transposase [Okeania sp. SIO1H6]|uniref:Uncharacterized protein n=1 Tax=Okeania hirsuta TaxID=1458930 RepID=A0A3N6PDD2_9CYAN|nr:transposase [Okeania sp. SIO2G5]NEP97079.1 transposase [Okeania sp. SIO2F5]NEQ94727.1 transposase [Okeania sp. SIO2G4]NES78755.1 transposase [Okeania sp. SIO1H4]NES90686.1 transposase [Okeania sp. SIO2B9]NET15936.1 transposase [Okeania sp. SIO1H6]NET22260.1 transposase [Okeania sp. SIO1H5]NET79779.1 transposase [Okeania sp. SIO1F9]NET95467.1 transposase [Okeania sp. SIO1H2]RQH14487.1 hypothetical protein D4Z78_22545 [Okeania hirsuta]